MNEAFIWLSGLCFIDQKKILMARNFFWIFTENKPVRGLRKKYNIPDVNWLRYLLYYYFLFIFCFKCFLRIELKLSNL